MKSLASSLALAAAVSAAVSAAIVPHQQAIGGSQEVIENELFLLELSPGETKWATEDEKWELRRNGKNFMDITSFGHTYPYVELSERSSVRYPSMPAYNTTVKKLAKELSKKQMRKHLETFTAFHTRYYKSSYGIESANWLYDQVKGEIEEVDGDKYGIRVDKFNHPWGQFSIIAQIPGKSNNTIIQSAHQDSINLFLPSILAAPGADDDGSGTVTILEALRVLLKSKDVVKGRAENTIEFHWYSAEEGGLLGSQAVFQHYAESGRVVKAMLQQDMTGYVSQTLAAGEPESVGVITDFVDPALTEFIKTVIDEYCDIPYVLTKCGYACSDHASASKYGYPSAFVIESDFKYSDKKIHTTEDKIEYLSFDHMLQHAKMTLAFAYEMAFAKF